MPALPADLHEAIARIAAAVTARHGDAGRRWLDGLPGLVAALGEEWRLTAGPAMPVLYSSLVLAARAEDGADAVLKLAFPDRALRLEAATLAAFAGHGCARLLAADPVRGALLVERIRPGDILGDYWERETAAAASVMVAMRAAAVPDALPLLAATVEPWVQAMDARREQLAHAGNGDRAAVISRAIEFAAGLVASSPAPVLLHGDLHHGNILAAPAGTWRAIDPRGLVGDPAFEPSAMLRDPWPSQERPDDPHGSMARRLDQFADLLGLDRPRILGWSLVQSVMIPLWHHGENADLTLWNHSSDILADLDRAGDGGRNRGESGMKEQPGVMASAMASRTRSREGGPESAEASPAGNDLEARLARIEATLALLQDDAELRRRLERLGLGAAPARPLPPSLLISAAEHLRPHQGFYPVEYTGDDEPYRWTGPSPAFSFELLVDRSRPLRLAMRVLAFSDYERQRHMTLLVDGEPVAIVVASVGTTYELTATVPAAARADATELLFILPKVQRPKEGGDPRELGLAFSRLTLVADAAEPVAG